MVEPHFRSQGPGYALKAPYRDDDGSAPSALSVLARNMLRVSRSCGKLTDVNKSSERT